MTTIVSAMVLVLSLVAIYAVMSFAVSRRTREIGVRMALGAVQGDVVWLVMREVLLLVTAGMILGLAAAWGLGRVVGAQLYGVTPNDPFTIAAAAAILAAVSLAAGYIPAIRATRVNPVLALRYE